MINFSLNACWRLIPTKSGRGELLCRFLLFIPYLFYVEIVETDNGINESMHIFCCSNRPLEALAV